MGALCFVKFLTTMKPDALSAVSVPSHLTGGPTRARGRFQMQAIALEDLKGKP
jgi:hypothetical protein